MSADRCHFCDKERCDQGEERYDVIFVGNCDTQRQRTHLEGNNLALRRPFVHQWLEYLRYLVHLDEQTTFPALNFVLRLTTRRIGCIEAGTSYQ